jgi:hypothetical protein
VFKPESNDQSARGFNSDFQNVVRLGLFEMIYGDVSLYYERALNKQFTAEIGLGLTFRDNFGGLIFDDDGSFFTETIDARIGNSFSLGFRVYPEYLFEDWYFSVELKYRQYKWFQPNLEGITTELDRRSYFMPRFNLGWAAYSDNNVCFDIFMGVSSARLTRYELYAYEHQGQTVLESYDWSIIYPRMHIGMRIGFGF